MTTPGPEATPILELRGVSVRYGAVEALRAVNLRVGGGEIVAILGANGAGKTTTLKAVSGLLRPASGEILLEGKPIQSVPAHALVRRGLAHSPEGRRIFGTLTVRENLMLGAFTRRDEDGIRETAKLVHGLFPVLEKRRDQLAGTLSGGEQQMLAIGRALMANPRVLLLDEPSLGLAPLLVQAIFRTIREINARGITVVLVEQNARAALRLAHRGYVLEVGRIVREGPAAELAADPEVQKAYLGGHGAGGRS